MPIRIAIICPGQFMASSDRSSSVERVCCEMSKQLLTAALFSHDL